MGQLPDNQSKANVCNYTAAPAAAPVYSEGIWSCSSLESVQHKGGIKPFLHSHLFASCTFCAISLVKHSTESFNVNCWIGSSGVWLFSLPSRGTSVLLRMGLVPINELIRCSLLWWLVLKLPARCVGVVFCFCFVLTKGIWRSAYRSSIKKSKILLFGTETYLFIAPLCFSPHPSSARSDQNGRHWTSASIAGAFVPSLVAVAASACTCSGQIELTWIHAGAAHGRSQVLKVVK